jgi:hypothetical protein
MKLHNSRPSPSVRQAALETFYTFLNFKTSYNKTPIARYLACGSHINCPVRLKYACNLRTDPPIWLKYWNDAVHAIEVVEQSRAIPQAWMSLHGVNSWITPKAVTRIFT